MLYRRNRQLSLACCVCQPCLHPFVSVCCKNCSICFHGLCGLLLAEHELLLVFLQELGGPLNIHKQTVDLSDVGDIDLGSLALLSNKVGGSNQVDAVTEGALLSNLTEELHGGLCQFDVLLLAADIQNLCELLVRVGLGGDDKGAIEQVDGQTVG